MSCDKENCKCSAEGDEKCEGCVDGGCKCEDKKCVCGNESCACKAGGENEVDSSVEKSSDE